MKDPVIPQFVVNTEQQLGITFSAIPDNSPQFLSENNSDAPSNVITANTDTLVADQGYIYNQPGFTYNQIGVMYGGIYNQNQDLAPAFFNDVATLLNPSISSIIDMQGSLAPPIGKSGQLMGILGLTYP